MHCELLVPALFSAPAGARHPSLELVLARARRSSSSSRVFESWLAEAFDIPDAVLPAGALTLLGEGRQPGDSLWARADPVHLRLMRERLILAPGAAFELRRDEAEALARALNEHFAGQLQIEVLAPACWCARLGRALASAAPSPLAAAGRDVQLSLPAESGGLQELLNEAQMLLHAHPVNAAREERGDPPVNSVWIWGAGRAPARAEGRWSSVSAQDPVVLGLARLAGARARPLAASAQAWLEHSPEDGRHLVVLDGLRAPFALLHEAEYHEAIEALEQGWFAPLLAALRAGRIGMLSVHVPDAAESLSFELIRGDLRRFWRRARPLEAYA
jgi:hypothetical protein